MDRAAEIIYGLVMVLTFTSVLSVAKSGRQQVREMLIAALGCNLAWGLIDGVMFILTSVVVRARRLLVIRGIRTAEPDAARALVMGALPEGVALVATPAEADQMVARFRALPEPSHRLAITMNDLRGALGACLLVFVATLPPTLPFVLFDNAARAQRISNAVAVVCLFLAGYVLGAKTGIRAWLLGLWMVILGAALVGICIALGG
jgi:VIT1/CCC1 family predicted Fe2+/Mn2+ transporter